MERCPCCMARLAETASVCPRCQADLAAVISSGQQARYWLGHAVRFWFGHQPELAMQALGKSLHLKRTPVAQVFSAFITRQQEQEVLALLAQRKLPEAKTKLSLLRGLQPDNSLLKQLEGFVGSLLG